MAFSFFDLLSALHAKFGKFTPDMAKVATKGVCRSPIEASLSETSLRVEVLASYASRMVVVADDRYHGSGGDNLDLVCVESFNLGAMPYFLDRIWVKRSDGVAEVVAAVERLLAP